MPNRFGRTDIDVNPLGNWHANVVTVQWRKWVLFVHDATRFPVMVKGLLKADFAALADHFEDSLMNTLLRCGAEERHMNAAVTCLSTRCCRVFDACWSMRELIQRLSARIAPGRG